MADQEGGRWDVGVKDNAVYLVRVSDSDERLFADHLAPEEARKLAELLRKYAGKVDESAEDGDDKNDDDADDADTDDDEDDDSEDGDSEDDDSEDDDSEDDKDRG
jgi:hypothetical protein